MPPRTNAPSASKDPSSAALLRSLLVPVDLTPASDRVLGRVARLPLADHARVTLLHVVPDDLPHRDQRSATRDAKHTLAEEARHLRSALPPSIHVDTVVIVGASAKAIAEHASATEAELVVMGRGGGRIRDAFLGSTAERVIRQAQLPVLVVRRPARAPYRRPLLALDVDEAARAIVPLVVRVLTVPRPRLSVIHAYTTPYHGLAYPSLAEVEDDDWRDELRRKITQELSTLLLAALADASLPPAEHPRWKLQVRHGPARTIIEKAVKKDDTDLLVLGTRGRSGVAHMLLGTVAGDVLREVACDVLVVPPAPSTTRTT